MKLKGLIAAGLAAMTLAGAPVAFATSTTATPAKEIVVQGGGAQNLGSGGSGTVGNTASVTQGADQFASNAGTIVQNTRSGASNIGQEGMQVASNIGSTTAANADAFAGQGTNQSGLSLFDVFKRADQLLTDGATNGLSFLLKLVYYGATFAIILAIGGVVWALLPWTKATVWKPLLGLAGSFIFFGIITAVTGVSIVDNPIVSAVKYIFFGG